MITSRSCPYRCTFCFHPTGKVYRERPLDDFFKELDSLVARYEINMVALIDELFSLKKQRLLEFCDRIEPYKLNWMVQLHVNCADDHILQRMKAAGCSYISYGVESMSQEVLISMQKKSKKTRIHEVLGNTYRHKIGIQGNLIFGDSAETLETANESMRWWAENPHFKIWVNRLLVYPGSPDYIRAVRDGLITDRVNFIANQAVDLNISKMNDADLRAIARKVLVAHRTLLDLAPIVKLEKQAEVDPLRGESYDILWDCPRCENRNDYEGVLLDPIEHRFSIRLTCRACSSRFDIRTPFQAPFDKRPTRRQDDADYSAAVELLAAGRENDAIDALDALHMRQLDYYPAPLKLAEIYEAKGNRLMAARYCALAVMYNPYIPQLHIHFGDSNVTEEALGMARLHYSQALKLDPKNAEAAEKLAALQGPQWTDAQRDTFFTSYSEAAPPKRLHEQAPPNDRRRETEFPDIAKLEEQARLELASLNSNTCV